MQKIKLTDKQRLLIYKRVLRTIKSRQKEGVSELNYWASICGNLLLELGKLKKKEIQSGLIIDRTDSWDSFKEFQPYHSGKGYWRGVKRFKTLYHSDMFEWRIKVLNKIITKLSNKISQAQ